MIHLDDAYNPIFDLKAFLSRNYVIFVSPKMLPRRPVSNHIPKHCMQSRNDAPHCRPPEAFLQQSE